jgi:hypothetical protein
MLRFVLMLLLGQLLLHNQEQAVQLHVFFVDLIFCLFLGCLLFGRFLLGLRCIFRFIKLSLNMDFGLLCVLFSWFSCWFMVNFLGLRLWFWLLNFHLLSTSVLFLFLLLLPILFIFLQFLVLHLLFRFAF